MKKLVFIALFFYWKALSAQYQYAEGESNSVKFGTTSNVGQIASGVSNTVHFYSRANRESASGVSNPVQFGSQTNQVMVQPNVVSQSIATRTIEPPKNEDKELTFESVPAYYALIIGESVYTNSNVHLSNLDRPTKDAQALYQTLTGKYFFKQENTKILNNASRAEIIEAFDDLAKKITPRDNLLVFYAGHGVWDENMKVGYWLPSDALSDKKYSWISNSNVKDYLGGINSKHTLLITDACFSGSIFKTRGDESLNDYGMAKLYSLPSRKAMTSGNLKSVPDQSKFFEFLNKRLNDNTQKYISARELFNSLYTAVLNNTNSVPLYGVIQDTGDEGGEFIFIKK